MNYSDDFREMIKMYNEELKKAQQKSKPVTQVVAQPVQSQEEKVPFESPIYVIPKYSVGNLNRYISFFLEDISNANILTNELSPILTGDTSNIYFPLNKISSIDIGNKFSPSCFLKNTFREHEVSTSALTVNAAFSLLKEYIVLANSVVLKQNIYNKMQIYFK